MMIVLYRAYDVSDSKDKIMNLNNLKPKKEEKPFQVIVNIRICLYLLILSSWERAFLFQTMELHFFFCLFMLELTLNLLKCGFHKIIALISR